MRHGICLADLDGNQREAALALMRETMSAAGYQSARDIMRLNEHALEITGKPEEYSEWFYWISLFGKPAPDAAWGWQIDGHHLNVNCFVLGDQLVLTPTSWARNRCSRALGNTKEPASSRRRKSKDMC